MISGSFFGLIQALSINFLKKKQQRGQEQSLLRNCRDPTIPLCLCDSVLLCPAAGRQGDSKKKTAAAAADSDDEDDWDAGRAGSKKKKGSKRKSTAKQKASATAQGQTGKAKQGSVSIEGHLFS